MSRLHEIAKTIGHRAMIILSALALMAGLLAAPAAARVEAGVASAVIPQARLGDAPQMMETISVGDRVNQDMLIETGKRGRTQVLFIDGSSMNIGPSSRVVIDEFVFDPGNLRGGLGARIEKGSMRFIGGVLSKRAGQVTFDVGNATVGIRGGIAKIAVQRDGKLQAELVHGRLRIATPQGVFETERIGTLIERDAEGGVATRSVTAAEVKTQLDAEASESLLEPQDAITDAPVDATTDATNGASDAPADESVVEEVADAQIDAPADASSVADAPVNEQADAPAEADKIDAKGTTGSALFDDPVDSGLVEIGADGKLTAGAALQELDPEAAKLVDAGAVALDEEGNVAPTKKILELDPIARKMFDEGLLEVDETGFLVATEDFDSEALYAQTGFDDAKEALVSDATLREFGFEEPEVLTREEEYKTNLAATRTLLAGDKTTATLYDLGQLEIDATGLLVPGDSFDPLIAARAAQASKASKAGGTGYIDDSAADRLLLDVGAFDTKVTTRVVGVEIATDIYDETVAKVVSADIVREDAIIAIDKLAAANGIALPEDIAERSLDELVSLGGALSTRDALKTSTGAPVDASVTPKIQIDTKAGEVVLRTVTDAGTVKEINAEKAFANLVDGTLDPKLAAQLVSPDALGEFLPQFDTGIKTGDGGSASVDASADISVDDFTDGLDKKTVLIPEADTKYAADDIADSGKESFVNALNDEFIDDDVSRNLVAIGISDDGQAAIAPQYDDQGSLETEQLKQKSVEKDQLIREQAEDRKEEAPVSVAALYRLSLAGQRRPTGKSSWGDANAIYWSAYATGVSQESALIRYSDNSVQMALEAGYEDGFGGTNAVSVASGETLGRATSLLAANNLSFATAVRAIAVTARARLQSTQAALKQTLITDEPAALQSRSNGVAICDCDQVATGIWATDSFTDAALQNITYEHKGHWAIGAPLSADTIRALAGMRASFSGHAYGSVTTPAGTSDGFGRVDVIVDFANPSSTSRNVWNLSQFSARNLATPVSASVPIRVDDSGRYIGQNGAATVDGGLFGTTRNLQTAGTFTVNRANAYAISGSYAGRGTATPAGGTR